MDLHINIKIMITEGGLQETLPQGSALFHLLVQQAIYP
jgi:hypothetical protein